MAMRTSKLSLGAGAAVLAAAALSLIHPWGNLRADSPVKQGAAVLAGANASDEVRNALVQKCGDCHSNNTRWPVYSRVAPAMWFIEHDVHDGRAHMNLSNWEQYSVENRIDLLAKMNTQIRQGKMPLKQYVLLHPEARLSDADRKLIQDWLKAERRSLIAQETK